jgi:raffinose/stachyose/melibiose transport system substrate-binding protein
MWALSDQTVLKAAVDAYNRDHPGAPITLRLYANDDYKQKLRVAFGADRAPDLFFNWGGGALDDYVKAGKAAALSPEAAGTNRFMPSVMRSATFRGRIYGVPCNGLAPVVLYYNKKVMAAAGLRPPTTYAELLADVRVLKDRGVVPLSLAANDKWPTLMYMEYLLDRIGGSQVFAAIAAGDSAAWKDPAVTAADRELQRLAAAGAFGGNASGMTYDQGVATALLYTGKAAMEVMGTWEYANIAKAAPAFLASGDLGWTSFPAVAGGRGDPADLVGTPANYLSLNAASTHKAQALAFLKDYVMNDAQQDAYLAAGSVPPVTGLEPKLAAASGSDAPWLRFVHGLVREAPGFQLSWDQDLPARQADPMLTGVDRSLLRQIRPERFGDAMSKVR